jgi:hypothetical protein
MPRRDDDIFKKLNKEKPLAKTVGERKDEDTGAGKNTFELMVEKKAAKRKKPVGTRGVYYTSKKRGDRTVVVSKSKAKKKEDLDIFSSKSPDFQNARKAERDIAFGQEKHNEQVERKQEPVQEHAPTSKRAEDVEKGELTFDAPKPQTPPVLESKPDIQEPRRVEKPQPSKAARQKPADVQRTVTQKVPAKVRKVLRHELKYYINYKDYYLLRASIGAVMKRDYNANESGKYHIRSLYFDDIYERALAEKVAGNDDRCKYRIRIYNYKDDQIKLERKQKHGQFIKKTSIELSRDEYESLIAGDCDFLLNHGSRMAKDVYIKMKTELLRPRVIVDYTREAYVSPIEDVRVTFDIDLKGSTMMSSIFDESIPCMPVYEHGMMVLEVKFNKYLPESIKCALSSAKAMQRSAISKYVLCRKFD